ncbi:hypothetical protein KIV40_30220, partial [Vibrio sp. D173a]|uniref:hypothetical protein n=1 Tax=Vibrio sp. D173a TaxID=2836349 RepID=UPI0025574408
MLTKKLNALLDHPSIDLGDIDTIAKASLSLLGSGLHLSDTSLWLTTDKNDVSCVYIECNEQTEVKENQIIPSEHFQQFLEQLKDKSHLAYSHLNAVNGQWLGLSDLHYFQSCLVPVRLNQEVIGFLLLRQAPHR